MVWLFICAPTVVLLLVLTVLDIRQKKHAILHNFPIVGHFRYWLESIGPELRQYIVTNNNEERPFSRDQRRWVYASSKAENNYFGFGTDIALDTMPNHLIIRQSQFPLNSPTVGSDDYDPQFCLPSAKILGGHRGRKKAFRPNSVINVSGMSFGALSAPAIEALNRGAAIAGCLHNTGEGAVSPHHEHGGDLVLQIGTSYFGCRDEQGHFDESRFRDLVAAHPIRAIEVKLSQGAKPGQGGFLPASKITPEISRIRGIPEGRDCASPAKHSEFDNVDGMLDFVERLADISGVPVGIKSAVGQMDFWHELADLMVHDDRGVDFITIDGGEGGTGAAPLVFADHVALPFKLAISNVFRVFAGRDIHQHVVFNGSGKLGFPASALLAFGLGCDMISVGREAMLAIGCIQAQKCHSGHCPTGVATQNAWLLSGLDPTHKAARVANYIITLRKEMLQLSRACGECHPALISTNHFDILENGLDAHSATKNFSYPKQLDYLHHRDVQEIKELMNAPIDVSGDGLLRDALTL